MANINVKDIDSAARILNLDPDVPADNRFNSNTALAYQYLENNRNEITAMLGKVDVNTRNLLNTIFTAMD